jgi:hypothetical protein
MIFEITPEQIGSLNDSDLRKLIAYLCEQELRAQKQSPVAVTAGGNQNAKDGGIDVRVALPDGSAITGYVPSATTGFQVKAQDMPRAEVLEEMAPKGFLRPSIAEIAERSGAYIIVSSKGSLADTALTDRKDAMREAVQGSEFGVSLTVDFYDRERVAMWVNQHPALIPWVREKIGQPLAGWRPFGDWSSSPTDIDKPYFLDEGVRLLSSSIDNANGLTATDGVNSLRGVLDKPGGVVRLVGLSGVGKTRLVQALFDDRVGSDALAARDAIYTDISDSPNPVPMELATRLVALRQRAILIVDNCGADLHQKLTTKVSDGQSLLSLITVEYDINDDEPERTNVFKLEVASVELIEKILEDRFPQIASPSRRTIAEFSDGNARIAFALAATAQSGDSLSNLKDKDLFRRLFEQGKGPNETLLSGAKACALLYSFDGETLEGDEAELPVLASLVGMSADQLYGSVSELIRRKLVQKRGRWRAILPHALAHRLARLALEDIPLPKIEAALVDGSNSRMLRSFSRRLGYMHDVSVVRNLVSKWLSVGGLLAKLGSLNELGEAILTNIAPVDPVLTLEYIEKAAGQIPEFFSDSNRNRSTVIRLLRSIAYDAALFDRCVSLLQKFARRSKKGNNSDNAHEVLKSLFYLYLSGTHASATQRAAFVRQCLEGDEADAQELGLELLRTMLESSHFASHYSFDFGARSRDYGANPRGKEIAEWFRHVIGVCNVVGMSKRPVARDVRRALASRFSEVAARTNVLDELDKLARDFAGDEGWPEGWIGVRNALRRWKKDAPADWVQRLETLSEVLQPTSLPDLVRSYALSKEWTALDIAELEEGEDGYSEEVRARIFEICVDLGKQLAEQPETLAAMLPEIFLSGSQKTIALGRGLASECKSLRESWTYLSEQFLATSEINRSLNLLSGFLEQAAKRDLPETELFLDGVLADPRLHRYFLFLQAYAGLTDESVNRLSAALDVKTVPIGTFQILGSGRIHEGMDDAQLSDFLRKLALRADGPPIAIEILGMRVFGAKSDKLSVSEAIKDMGRELIAQVSFTNRESHHHEFMLARLIEVSLDRPEDYPLAHELCTKIAEGMDRYLVSSDISEILKALTKVCPRAVLDVLVENYESSRARSLFRDLRETRPDPLSELSEDAIIAWATEKPETRYPALAQVIRFADAGDDTSSKCWSPAAERIIELAPDVKRVLNVFLSRFQPMGWNGSRAEIMGSRVSLIQSLAGHARPEIAEWAATSLPVFEARVAQERASEATRDKDRDERFE